MKLQSKLPWVSWSWCFAYRLELACKDAFTSPLFAQINVLLLRLYYLYEKSPKKSQELSAIFNDLKEVFSMPNGGTVPVRCHGTRWITYKRKALQRILDRYGLYIAHLTTLSQDRAVTAADRAKPSGYLRKWCDCKVLIGCAMYAEIIKAPSLLSLTLQGDALHILSGINHIVKAVNSLLCLSKQDPLEWSHVKILLSKVSAEGSHKIYQGCTLSNFGEQELARCSSQAISDLTQLDGKIRERLQWSDMRLLRSILVFLDTRTWALYERQRLLDDATEQGNMDDIIMATDYILSLFRVLLEAKGACLSSFNDELEDIVGFARKYLNIMTEDYKKVWYKLHATPDSRNWPTVLLLSELLFSLPFTTSAVERVFSKLKVIKTDRRSRLLTATVDDLLEINVEGPSLEEFSSEAAVSLWWDDRIRRPSQTGHLKRQGEIDQTSSPTSSTSFSLQEWDELF